MAEKLLMLALSPTMEKALISSWLKKEGDTVSTGDILCEVETDKATMDYESIVDGVLLKIVVPEGAEAAVGDLIAIVGEEGEDVSDLLEEAAAETKKDAKTERKIPPDEAPAAADTDQEVAADVETETEPSGSDFIRSSPLARKLAAEYSLNLADIAGSGPAGRIVKADVDAARSTVRKAPAKAPAAVQAAREDIVIPHNNVRRIVAERLAESKFSAPHYYLKVSAEVDRLMDARRQLNKTAAESVSVNAFLIKLAAEALKRHPRVNAGWNGDSIIQFGRIDIGLAVAQEDGLITPVVRDAAGKGILQINEELAILVDKAQNNRLTPEEYTGATFTISSLGSFGIDDFTAIINPPGSAILAVGAIKKDVVVSDDDEIVIRSLMRLSLSCDHRTIDGAVGALFLNDLKQMIESPIRALY
jgi:pyruvate dehydrogenase E2 component (dihydrolipoamide acetyltransferase)